MDPPVVSEAFTVTVTFDDASERTARIIGSDCEHDLALLKVDGVRNLPVLELGDSGSTAPGDAVIAVGYALGLDGGSASPPESSPPPAGHPLRIQDSGRVAR